MESYFKTISVVTLVIIALFISWLFSLIVRSLINAYRFSILIRRLPQGPRPLPVVGNALSFKGRFDCTSVNPNIVTVLLNVNVAFCYLVRHTPAVTSELASQLWRNLLRLHWTYLQCQHLITGAIRGNCDILTHNIGASAHNTFSM